MEFSGQGYWSGPFPSPGHLPAPEMEPASPASAGRWILYHQATGEAAHSVVRQSHPKTSELTEHEVGLAVRGY